MKRLNSKYVKKICLITICIVSILIFICACVKLVTKDNRVYDIINIEQGWDIQYGDTEVSNVNLVKYKFYRLEKGQVIVATKKLDKIKNNVVYPIFNVKTTNCLMDIYVNNKKVEGNISDEYDSNVYVKSDIIAHLPDNYENKEIRIKFFVLDSSNLNIVENANIMSENDYIYHKIRSNIVIYLVGAIMIILGMILIISVICIPYGSTIIRRLLWIGGVFLFVGLAMYAKYDILELFISNSRTIETIETISVFLCMPCVAMVGYETFKCSAYRKHIISYVIFLLVLSVACIFSSNTGNMFFEEVSDIYVLVMYATALIMLVFSAFNYKQVNDIEKISIIGMIVCYCQTMLTILLSQLLDIEVWNKKGQYFIIAVIVEFFICMIVYYAFVVKKYMNGITEQRILETLAYTDPLTGLMNRTKYEEIIDDLKEKVNGAITVVSFDLNNLKKINDNNGHEAGDIYIKEFTNAIKKSFEIYGFICRIGGDEFVSIIENTDINVGEIISSMQKIFVDGMKRNKCEFEASFAYGIASTTKDKISNIDELLSLADSRMYECKIKQKQGRN